VKILAYVFSGIMSNCQVPLSNYRKSRQNCAKRCLIQYLTYLLVVFTPSST